MMRRTNNSVERIHCCLILVALGLMGLVSPVQAQDVVAQMVQNTVRVLNIEPHGPNEAYSYGKGSGFVIGDGRHVATNWHVVDASAQGWEVVVFLSEQEQIPGQVVWHSESIDLAIIELSRSSNRPPSTFSLSSYVQLAQPVFAMGFPGAADLGDRGFYEVKITNGIVSAFVEDQDQNQDIIRKLYQTDAAINPGNSGGPLFDRCGHVIGVNVEKSYAEALTILRGRTADNRDTVVTTTTKVTQGEGIGWSIQIDELIPALKQLGIPYEATNEPCLSDADALVQANNDLKDELDGYQQQLDNARQELAAASSAANSARTQAARLKVTQLEQATEMRAAIMKADTRADSLRKVIDANRSDRKDAEEEQRYLLYGSFLIGMVGIGLALTKRGRVIIKELSRPLTGGLSKRFGDRQPDVRLEAPGQPGGASPGLKPVLCGITGEMAGQVFPLDDQPVTLGRDPQVSQIVLSRESGASKRHCTIRYDKAAGGFILEDNHSTNRTYLDGGAEIAPGVPRQLAPGTRFYLSDPNTMFEVRIG